jgi:hypothetical protein
MASINEMEMKLKQLEENNMILKKHIISQYLVLLYLEPLEVELMKIYENILILIYQEI